MNTALLVIDVQTGLVAGNPPVYRHASMLRTIQRLIVRARGHKVPVIYIQDDEVGTPGSLGWEVHPGVAPQEGDLRVRKLACDAFHGTRLHRALSALRVKRLVVVGCKTQFCVDTTVRRAASLGYDVTLVADGHSTTDSRVLPAKRIIAHHNHLLHGLGAGRHEVCVKRASAVRL